MDVKLQKTKTAPTAAILSNNNLISYSPKQLDLVFRGRITSELEAADSKTVNLYGLRRIHSDEKVKALLILHLARLNVLLDLKRPLSDEMLDFISDGIIAEFSYMNMADIWLVMNRAITGVYGEMYESLNPAKVLGWFRKYWEERLFLCEERSIQKGNELKQEGNRTAERFFENKNVETVGDMIKYLYKNK